jgi:hypothetical protein
MHSDSSNTAWAGVGVQTGTVVHECWREKGFLHINVKELEAAVNGAGQLEAPAAGRVWGWGDKKEEGLLQECKIFI